MEDQKRTAERLSKDACLSLLSERQAGRIAIVDGDQPIVIPVNYAISGDTVLLRTDEGSAIERLLPALVAFEIDEFSADDATGWSVLVKGLAKDVSHSLDQWSEALRELELTPWAPGEKPVWVAIAPSEITGLKLI